MRQCDGAALVQCARGVGPPVTLTSIPENTEGFSLLRAAVREGGSSSRGGGWPLLILAEVGVLSPNHPGPGLDQAVRLALGQIGEDRASARFLVYQGQVPRRAHEQARVNADCDKQRT